MLYRNTFKANEQKGALLVTVMIIMFFLMTMLLGLILLASFNLSRASQRIFLLQTQYASETGADIALTNLNTGSTTPYALTPEKTVITSGNRYKATYRVKMEASPSGNNNEKIITSTGYLYTPANATNPKYTRTIKITSRRSGTTATTAVLSRNIIQIASSVKEVHAKDVFVNDYIQLDKNTNELIAENITAGGRNTGASNCSLSGSGDVVKPTTFTTPGQTKTQLRLAYNNCLTPPGNTSNANFDVAHNQNDIERVQSTYIPWNYAMDGSYTNSTSGCNELTSGSPRNLPSASNPKKTHYPDSGSGVALLGCGLLGTVNLGNATYNINDHVHIRANLCDTVFNCSPVFNNPTASLKFVFVEGTINFRGVDTAPGSGPIVFVAYGADPLVLLGICPLGGAIYLGQNLLGFDTSSAPAAYFLAANGGVCIDRTRFDSALGLGGISGKNLYISPHPGTPFDLSFNPLFPVDQIPVNLSWKAAQYQRLK